MASAKGARRWLAATTLVLLLAGCTSGTDAEQGAEPSSTTAPPDQVDASEVTTTTGPRGERQLETIAALPDIDRARIRLRVHPPDFPPPLAPSAPPPDFQPRPVEVVQIGPDRQPVFDETGTPSVFLVHFDHLGQFVRDAAGAIAVEGEGSLVYGDDGAPLLLTPARDPGGELVRDAEGRVVLDPVPQPPPRNPLMVFGDSVILGAAANLPDLLPGWAVTVDAEESRLAGHADEVVRARRGEVGRAAVVMLGHNSGAAEDHAFHIREIMHALDGVERVVWVTAAEWGPGQIEWNDAVEAIAASGEFPNMVVADWAPWNAAYPHYNYDGLHLTPEGRVELGQLVSGYLGPPPD